MAASYDQDAALLSDLKNSEVETEARNLYYEVDAYQHRLISKYYRYHHWYAPLWGDQWPEDGAVRPGKIHLTVNFIKPAVDIDARLQALMPRIALQPDGIDDQDRRRAAASEKIHRRLLEASDWEVWLSTLTKTKCLYGKGILKPFWNKEDGRPDVKVLENPANLRLGWGSSDFSVLDWAIYEYSISPVQAMRQFPEITVHPTKGPGPLLVTRASDHTDPLNMLPVDPSGSVSIQVLHRPVPYLPSDYERKQVKVWDFWFRDEKGTVHNAQLVSGTLAKDIAVHPELMDIPYIVIENDHEPGTPEGISSAESLIDLQIEYNRALSHWSQLVADETDPAWQMTGENADSVPDGIVPTGGEIVAAGSGNEIKPIAKPMNQMAIQTLLAEFWQTFHRISGLSEIQFGQANGTQTTGRALAVQVEAALNRLDPKRRLLYKGLKQLLMFWTHMLVVQNPSFEFQGLSGEPETKHVKDIVQGLSRWKIIAPEITPKDAIENTQNEINKVNAKIISLHSAMDNLGTDSPEDELALIEEERSNAHLFPGEVQSFTATLISLSQLSQQLAQMGMTPQQFLGNSVAGTPDKTGQGVAANQAQQAQPTLGEGDNQPQPMSQPGSPPAPGGPPQNLPGNPSLQQRVNLSSTPGGGVQDKSQIRMINSIAGHPPGSRP